MSRYLAIVALIAVSVLAFQNCQEFETRATESDLVNLYMEIEEAVATQCVDSSECAQMAIGSKACGGPWGYLVYSRAATDEARLTDLVDKYNRLEERYNIQNNIASTCEMILPAESLVCDQSACRGSGT